ncbi:hypothetical protein CBS101457_004631 [Exobasidium rhododendri]|nr:hypothetical protein CBS101457_004631 [Exobasidium rhododendri]
MATATTPRRTSNQKFRSKFSVSYEALLDGEHPWSGIPSSQSSSSVSSAATPLGSSYSNAGSSYFSAKGKKPLAPRTRFFADILCLKVEFSTLEELVHNIPARLLVDDDEGSKGARIRDNVGSLWRECLRLWSDIGHAQDESPNLSAHNDRSNGSDEVRRKNAIDTLLVLSGSILAKSALAKSSTSLDLIWIFAGGIDEADDVFEGLVNAIDEGLRGELDNYSHRMRQRQPGRMPSSDMHPTQHFTSPTPPTEVPTLADLLHHRTKAVKLAVIWLSYISSTNLSAYFVRRDLFVAACSLLTTVQSIRKSASTKAAQSMGGLAEADEDLLRITVREVSLLIGLLASLGNGASSSGPGAGGRSFSMTGTSHSPYFRRLCDWVDSGSMTLLRDSFSYDLRQSWRAYEEPGSPFASTSATGTLTWGAATSFGAVSEGVKRLGLGSNGHISEHAITSATDLPPPSACCLLPILLLSRANQAFVDIALAATDEANKDEASGKNGNDGIHYTFTSSLLSLSSYLATHGSLSHRSKSYSRLSMLVSLALLSSTAGLSALVHSERQHEIASTRQCQQRSGPRSVRNTTANETSTGGFSNFISQLSFSGPSSETNRPNRLLPFILDSCVQYLRYNLRKRLDVSGYLICLEVVKLSIETCAERKVLLEYSGWVDVWRSIQTVIAFLVGRHTELRGIEIGDLGKSLISTLSFALKESDRYLQSKDDVNVLIFELVRSSETLRRFACISITGKDPLEAGVDAALLRTEADQIVRGLPGWKLIDMVLLSFEERLQDWKDTNGSKDFFNFGLTWSNVTAGYFKGASTESKASAIKSTSKDMPEVDTVMRLISSLDLERLISTIAGLENGSLLSRGESAKKTSQSFSLEEERLQRAESQCISEAIRCTSEDLRHLMASVS